MKNLILLGALILAAQAQAIDSLKIPVFVEGDKGAIPAAVINQQLKAKGINERLPIFFIATQDYNNATKLDQLNKQVENLMARLGNKYGSLQSESIPGENNYKTLRTCYTGKADIAVDIVYGLTDIYYSDQMTLLGWKHKRQTNYSENLADDKDGQRWLYKESKAWRTFKGQNNDLLVLASIGDDGTDVNESLIPECSSK